MIKRVTSIFLFIFFLENFCFSQQFFFRNNGNYRYFLGTSQPPANWKNPDFDDSGWLQGFKSIGYGDGDDSTIIPKTPSVYLRIHFNLPDSSYLNNSNLLVDFDDGFIAYLNGREIIRINLGIPGDSVSHNTLTDRSHEAQNYRNVYMPIHGFYLDDTLLLSCLKDTNNILAVEVHNDSIIGSDMSFVCHLLKLNPNNFDIYNNNYRYRRYTVLDSTAFPIINIETSEYELFQDHEKFPAHMGIIYNGLNNVNKPSDLFNNYNGDISIEVRGESSREFYKRPYNVHTLDPAGKNLNVSLLGMPAENDWILIGPFADKSQIRNEIVFSLGRKLGYYEPRTRYCEVIFNGEYQGLYILTEKIKQDSNRVNISRLKPEDLYGNDITGGYIIKHDKPASWRIQFVDPGEDALAPAQKEYITDYMVTYYSLLLTPQFNDPMFGYRDYIDPNSLIDYVLITELCKNADSYNMSTYMYKDRFDKDGRIKFGPLWDYDLAFGNTIFQDGYKTDGWQFTINTRLYITHLFADTMLTTALKNRWFQLRQTAFNTDTLIHLIDSLVNYVRDARIRNYNHWPVINQMIFGTYYLRYATTYDQDIQLMKEWLLERLDWIDNNISNIYYPYPQPLTNGEEFTLNSEDKFNVYPNPFKENITIEMNLTETKELCIEIYDLNGRMIYQVAEKRYESGIQPVIIDIQLKEGIYFLNVISQSRAEYQGMIIKN